MRSNFDVVVAGGGIVGAACALVCTQEGLRTLLVEPSVVGGGATAAGMGHVVVMDDSDAQFALTRFSQLRWNAILPDAPDSLELLRCGTIWVAADAEEMEVVRCKGEFYRMRGVDAEVLDARTLYDCEPLLRPGLAGGLRVPGDFVIYPPAAARWMVDEARRQGASIRYGDAVAGPHKGELRLRSGETVRTRAWIIATGTQARDFVPSLPLRPRKGHLVITDRYPGALRHQLIELGYLKSAHGNARQSIAFNAQPRRTGQILLGSSRQYDAESAAVESAVVARLVARGMEYLPGLARMSVIRAWTGFRAATPDALPLIGRWDEAPSCTVQTYLAIGHEGLGITTCLGTAELIAAEVAGRPAAIPAAPYRPDRFRTGSETANLQD